MWSLISKRLFHTSSCLRNNITKTPNAVPISIAHTCWFHIPEQQMKSYEVLAKGSGFVVATKYPQVLLAMVSAHVAAPFLFRQYFPQDWLSFVKEEHCKHSLEWLVENEHQWKQLETGDEIFRHEELDIAALVLRKERLMETQWHSLLSKVVTLQRIENNLGRKVMLSGWQVDGAVGSGEEQVSACEVEGIIQVQQGNRFFIQSNNIIKNGMCGGPVLVSKEERNSLGIVEGIVPMEWKEEWQSLPQEVQDFLRKVAGYTAFIDSDVLIEFVQAIEKEL
eukprot:jgi/Galph1/2311/GphlegSOOS_G1012.1